jgi:hypothetical protein
VQYYFRDIRRIFEVRSDRNVRSPVHFDSWIVYIITQESKLYNKIEL